VSHGIVPLELQVPSLAILSLFLAWVIRLIRRQRLSLRESLPWLLSTAGALVVTAWPEILAHVAAMFRIQVPANAFFAVGILYLAMNVLSVTIIASSNADRVRRLTQECAMLRAEIEALRSERAPRTPGKLGSPPGSGPSRSTASTGPAPT
jgi:hypothetical protein